MAVYYFILVMHKKANFRAVGMHGAAASACAAAALHGVAHRPAPALWT